MNTVTAFVENMRVDHCGLHILVSEQFLNRANVVATFEQMRCEAVPEGVTADALRNSGCSHCLFNCFLHTALVQVMPTHQSVAWMLGDLTGLLAAAGLYR